MWWMWSAWDIGMMLMMLVFWGLVIVALVVGIRWLMRGLRPSPADRAFDILRERYARGEISKEEFDAKLRETWEVDHDRAHAGDAGPRHRLLALLDSRPARPCLRRDLETPLPQWEGPFMRPLLIVISLRCCQRRRGLESSDGISGSTP